MRLCDLVVGEIAAGCHPGSIPGPARTGATPLFSLMFLIGLCATLTWRSANRLSPGLQPDAMGERCAGAQQPDLIEPPDHRAALLDIDRARLGGLCLDFIDMGEDRYLVAKADIVAPLAACATRAADRPG